jgi:hypothetical protein
MRRRLHRVDERLATSFATQATELVRTDDDHFFSAMRRDMLRALVLGTPHELAELCLRIL